MQGNIHIDDDNDDDPVGGDGDVISSQVTNRDSHCYAKLHKCSIFSHIHNTEHNLRRTDKREEYWHTQDIH